MVIVTEMSVAGMHVKSSGQSRSVHAVRSAQSLSPVQTAQVTHTRVGGVAATTKIHTWLSSVPRTSSIDDGIMAEIGVTEAEFVLRTTEASIRKTLTGTPLLTAVVEGT
jgi:hypothetical protein